MLGLNTYSFSFDHDAVATVDILRRLEVRSVEFILHPGHIWPSEMSAAARADLAARLKDADITVVSLNQPQIDLNLTAASDEMRRFSRESVRAAIALAGDIGAQNVIIGPGKANYLYPMPRDRQRDLFLECLRELAPAAREVNTRLAVENMAVSFIPDAHGIADVLDEFADPDVGVIYDATNAYYIDDDIDAGLLRLRDRIRAVHLSDTGRDKYRHAPIGTGTMDFTAVAESLKILGRHVPVLLEIIWSDPLREIPACVSALHRAGIR